MSLPPQRENYKRSACTVLVTFPGAENDPHHMQAQGRRLAITDDADLTTCKLALTLNRNQL